MLAWLICFFLLGEVFADEKSLAADLQWQRLLHRRPTLFRSTASRIRSPAFFLHPKGNHDAEAELSATLKAFQQDPLTLCAFPARVRFLQRHGHQELSLSHCQEFLDWESELGHDQVHLIFAGAYPNNPASLFGHTLLRFSKSERGELRDYGVAFLASTDPNDSAPVYTWRGLTGGYPGYFEIEPFARTVGLYNNSESRSLWSYELDLTGPERLMLTAHLWELMHRGEFAYYFFDENCSFMLLTLLEVARPELNLTGSFRGLVLPLETVKAVAQNLKLSYRGRRASLLEELETKEQKLSWQQMERLGLILKGKERALEELDALELEILSDHLQIKLYQNQGAIADREHQLLLDAQTRRARYESTPLRPMRDMSSPPDQSHPPRRIQWGGDSEERIWLNLGLGLHNFSDHPAGYQEFAAIDYLEATLQLERRRLSLKQATLVRITSLNAISLLRPELSWRAEIAGGEQSLFADRAHLFVKGGPGIATSWEGVTGGVFFVPIVWMTWESRRSFGLLSAELIVNYQPRVEWLGATAEMRVASGWREEQLAVHLRPNLKTVWSLSGVRFSQEKERVALSFSWRW